MLDDLVRKEHALTIWSMVRANDVEMHVQSTTASGASIQLRLVLGNYGSPSDDYKTVRVDKDKELFLERSDVRPTFWRVRALKV